MTRALACQKNTRQYGRGVEETADEPRSAATQTWVRGSGPRRNSNQIHRLSRGWTPSSQSRALCAAFEIIRRDAGGYKHGWRPQQAMRGRTAWPGQQRALTPTFGPL